MTMSASTVDFHYSINNNNNAPWDEWCYNNSGAFLPFPSSWPTDNSPVEDLSHMVMPTKSAVPFPKFINPESLQSFSASSTSPISNGDSDDYEPSTSHTDKKRKTHGKHDCKAGLLVDDSVTTSQLHCLLPSANNPPQKASSRLQPQGCARACAKGTQSHCRGQVSSQE